MQKFIAGKDAFIELLQRSEKLAGNARELDVAVVVFNTADTTVRKIILTNEHTMFFCYTSEVNKDNAIPITNGDKFDADVLLKFRGSRALDGTKFVDRSGPTK